MKGTVPGEGGGPGRWLSGVSIPKIGRRSFRVQGVGLWLWSLGNPTKAVGSCIPGSTKGPLKPSSLPKIGDPNIVPLNTRIPIRTSK